MPLETLQIPLLLVAWVIAFLLGKELQNGFVAWRHARAERPGSRKD
jgi:hypothetical protein